MENWITKKNVFLASVGGSFATVLLTVINAQQYSKFCEFVDETGHGLNYCMGTAFVIFPLVWILPFSLVLYFFRDGVYKSWLAFARWWIPLSMLLLLITPGDGDGGVVPVSALALTMIFACGVFTSVSVAIIIAATVREYRLHKK